MPTSQNTSQTAVTGSSFKAFTGYVDYFDEKLINGNVDQYIDNPTIRIQVHIDRVTDNISQVDKQLKLYRENPSLIGAKEKLSELENHKIALKEELQGYRQEFSQISPVHAISLYVKDSKKVLDVGQTFLKKALLGRQATYLDTLKEANDSIEVLVGQMSSAKKATIIRQEEAPNVVEIIKQYERIESQLQKAQDNYQSGFSFNVGNGLRSFVRKLGALYDLQK